MPSGIPKNGINTGWFKKGDTHKMSEATKEKIRQKLLGRKASKELRKKLSIVHKLHPTRYWLGKHISPEHNAKLQEGKNRMEHPPNWRGGISDKNNIIRHSKEMKLWRKSVFERDNFTCQKYGVVGGKLRAHHMNNFSEFPELRFAIDNGVTLSETAHREFHRKYGIKNNTREQLIEFLND